MADSEEPTMTIDELLQEEENKRQDIKNLMITSNNFTLANPTSRMQ